MEILILKENEMKEVIDIKEAIAANKIAVENYSENKADIPLRTNLNIDKYNGQSLYMPGYLADENALGVKIVSVYPNNVERKITAVPSLMLLVDDETGFPNCMMDGTYLTQLRTGALAGLGTELLSREDSKVFTLIGTGGQAELQLEAVLAVRDIQTVYVSGRNKDKCNKFAKEMSDKFKDKYKVEIKASVDLEKEIGESDIITSVTTSKNPTFNSDWVRIGTHINGVGSPEMVEIDGNLILKADKVYCDTKDALVESGDFVNIINKGIFKESDITGELGELALEKTIGRESKEEITFFKTTGNAVLDIMVAKKIYDLAKLKSVGNVISI